MYHRSQIGPTNGEYTVATYWLQHCKPWHVYVIRLWVTWTAKLFCRRMQCEELLAMLSLISETPKVLVKPFRHIISYILITYNKQTGFLRWPCKPTEVWKTSQFTRPPAVQSSTPWKVHGCHVGVHESGLYWGPMGRLWRLSFVDVTLRCVEMHVRVSHQEVIAVFQACPK